MEGEDDEAGAPEGAPGEAGRRGPATLEDEDRGERWRGRLAGGAAGERGRDSVHALATWP